MSEWNSKNKPGVKTRDPEYPDLTTDFADPYNDNNQYRGKDSLVGWYRFLGNNAVGRVDGGTTNTFPNMALTGSSGQTLTTSGSLGSAVYYEESKYGAEVTYKARYQSPFDELNFDSPTGLASVVSEQWGYSFNQQVTPYLPTNMANGALPFSGSKAEKNYFRITDTDNWNIYSSGAEFSVAVWVRMNDYQNGQQATEQLLPIITKVKQGDSWTAGGEFVMFWYPVSTTSNTVFAMVMDDSGNEGYARSGYFANSQGAKGMDSTTYPEPLAVPPNGSWVHLVMTWNGTNTDSATTKPSSNSTDGIKTYINGHFMLYDNTMGSFDGDIRPATDSTCGDILINSGRDDDDPTAASKYTNQDIAEAAFWSKCLSPKEVKALYHGATQGIKKWDSGLVKNPARPQLQRLDDTDGNAYPTIAGSANQERLGKRTPYFDDTLTRMFLSSSALAAGDITMGARLPTDDKLLSASFSTPNKLPSLVVSASQRSNTPGHTDSTGTSVPTWGIDPRIMGNLPFLTASVTEFKDPIKPYDDSKYYIDNNVPFYVSSSIRMPGFNSRVDNKVMITIDTNPKQDSAFGICQQPYGRPGHANMIAPGGLYVEGGTSPGPGSAVNNPGTDYGNEAWFMGYWNNNLKRWERIGRGYTTPWSINQTPKWYSMYGFDGNVAPSLIGRSSLSRNIDQACIGFPGMNQYIFSASVCTFGALPTTTSLTNLPSPKVQFHNTGRPITNFGFPFHGRYEATGSQLIKMSDYIDRPFLVEKIIIEYSGSHDFPASSTSNRQKDIWKSATIGSNGNGTSPTLPHFHNATSFFILRQRADKFEISGSGRYPARIDVATTPATRHDKPGDPVPNFKQTSISTYGGPPGQASLGAGSITSFLTGAIPGKAFTNPSDDWWDNPQSNKTLATTTRDLVTYAQHVIHGFTGNVTASYNNGNDFPMDPHELIAAGMGRDLNTYVPAIDNTSAYLPANRESGPQWSNKTMKPFGFTTANQLTGSYILTASCRSSVKTPWAGMLEVRSDGVSSNQSQIQLDNLIGGRMNPAGQLGDRRPLIAGLPSGKDSEEPITVPSRGYVRQYPPASGIYLRPMGFLTGSTLESFKEADSSPYLLMPGDNIILGIQAPFVRDTVNNWTGGQAAGCKAIVDGGGSVTTDGSGWVANEGFSVGIHPGAGKFILIGSYIKDHRQHNISSNQQLTTPSVHGVMSDGTVLDQWEIDSKMSYSGSYLDNSIEGAMTSPATGWPREPFKQKRSTWAAASSMASASAAPKNGPWDGYLKPWVARDSSGNAVASAASDDVDYDECKEPASTRYVGATAFGGTAGDIFGFQRNVRLDCSEETYYDSLVPDPGVCWAADNQPLGWAGGTIAENNDAGVRTTLAIGASNGGNQAGTAVAGGTDKYSNEWWLPSFPFEARYRGFSEPPTDDFKRKIEQNSAYLIRLCLPSFGTAPETWNGFDAKGTDLASTNQSAKCVGVVGVYVDGLKPGLARAAGSNWGAYYSTIDTDMNGTILPVLFGIGNGLSGSVSPYKRVAATGTSTTVDGAYKYLSNKPSGCKYGLYSWKPRVTSTIFRSNKFGQMRDMLEQRRYSRFYLSSDSAVETNAPVVCQFKEPAWLAPTEDTDKSPTSTQCSNLSLFATSSVPYFDGEVKNRGPLIADGSDTIVIE